MFLAGTFELTIDGKNRLSIPFPIRRKLDAERDGHSFYVVPGRRRRTLSLYPEKHYEKLRDKVPADDRLSDDTYEYRQWEYSQSALLDPDTQGRILIPERLLKRAGLDKEVALIAVRDHLELWNRKEFDKFESGMWEAYPEKRTNAVRESEALTKDGNHKAATSADESGR
jgi:MraZ protein